MKKIRLGVLGAAKILEKSVGQSILLSPTVEFAGIAARDPDRARKLSNQFQTKAYTTYEELLADPSVDAVYIPLPVGLHHEWGLRALKAGKHVILEKSLTNSLEHAEELIELARSRSLLLMENIMCAHHRQHHVIQAEIQKGSIGRPRFLRAWFGIPALPADDIRHSKALGGGALHDLGVYVIWCARFFLGDEFKLLSKSLSVGNSGVDESGCVHLQGRSGIDASLTFGFSMDYRNEYEIWGSNGSLRTTRAFSIPRDLPPPVTLKQGQKEISLDLPPDDHFTNLLGDFARRIWEKDFESAYASIAAQAKAMELVRRS